MADYELFAQACENLSVWASEPGLLPVLQRDIARLNEQLDRNPGDSDLRQELCDRFCGTLPFSGATVRALTGAGTARMNIYTVRQAARAAVQLLRAKGAEPPCVAIGYDCRPLSDRFALELAGVFLAAGIRVHLLPACAPSALLVFVTQALHCSMGILVTGGRSPAGYSGLKFYGAGGAPLSEADSKALEASLASFSPFAIEWVAADTPAFTETLAGDGTPLLQIVPADMTDRYKETLPAQGSPLPAALSVVYTTMNGSGHTLLPQLLSAAGVSAQPVPEQQKPDGSFTTCPSPDPEKQEALRKGLLLCETQGSPDLLLAVSPDCGAFGCACKELSPKEGKGSYLPLSGNQLGVLLLQYLCESGRLPKGSILYKTQIVTPMADDIAQSYGLTVQTFAGDFRAIGRTLVKEPAGKPFFAFDGTGSYLFADSVPDRDGLAAALLTVQMAAYYKKKQQTLGARLEALSETYGYYTDRELEFRYESANEPIADEVMRMLSESYLDAEGVRIFVRSSKAESKVKVNVALRKDSKEEAAAAMNQAEFTIRGHIKEWLHAIKH